MALLDASSEVVDLKRGQVLALIPLSQLGNLPLKVLDTNRKDHPKQSDK
jgi:hypothetical protein